MHLLQDKTLVEIGHEIKSINMNPFKCIYIFKRFIYKRETFLSHPETLKLKETFLKSDIYRKNSDLTWFWFYWAVSVTTKACNYNFTVYVILQNTDYVIYMYCTNSSSKIIFLIGSFMLLGWNHLSSSCKSMSKLWKHDSI